MGMAIGEGTVNDALTLERMSTNISTAMKALAENESIFSLLYYNDNNPFNHNLADYEEAKALEDFTSGAIMNMSSEKNRISPIPFNPEAQTTSQAFIRVYYNQGSFTSGEVIGTSQMHIDIICSKHLWLINDTVRQLPIIRPYAIMSRVIDIVGRNGSSGLKLGMLQGFQHLSVNAEFECIRLYVSTFEVKK